MEWNRAITTKDLDLIKLSWELKTGNHGLENRNWELKTTLFNRGRKITCFERIKFLENI